MKPDAKRHNPDPSYLRELIRSSGLSQVAAAERIGISGRSMRRHLSTAGHPEYPIQYALECLAGNVEESCQLAVILSETLQIAMDYAEEYQEIPRAEIETWPWVKRARQAIKQTLDP